MNPSRMNTEADRCCEGDGSEELLLTRMSLSVPVASSLARFASFVPIVRSDCSRSHTLQDRLSFPPMTVYLVRFLFCHSAQLSRRAVIPFLVGSLDFPLQLPIFEPFTSPPRWSLLLFPFFSSHQTFCQSLHSAHVVAIPPLF